MVVNMWEMWLYKTIMAFMSIQAIQLAFGEYIIALLKNQNKKPIGTPKALLNCALLSMIPVIRWLLVAIMIIGVGMGMIIKEREEK